MRLTLAVIALFWITAAHAVPPAAVQVEIDYLLSAIETSDCRFERNGTWYDAKAAAAHLRLKFANLAARDLIRNTDDFIERAGTKSSITGRDYAIKCAGLAEKSSRQWLTDVLVAYRASHTVTPPRAP